MKTNDNAFQLEVEKININPAAISELSKDLNNSIETIWLNLSSKLSSGTEAAIRETVKKSSQTIKTEYANLSNDLKNIGNEAFGNTFSDLLSGETDKIGDHVICPAIHSARGRAYGGTLVATSANR